MLLASSSQEIKLHDWETSKLSGIYKPCSERPKQNTYFNDLTWSCDGTYLVATQTTGKALLLKPSSSLRTDMFIPEKDVINCSCVKSAQFSRTQNHLIALGTTVGHLLHFNLVSKYSNLIVHDFPGCVNKVSYAANDSYLGVACSNGQIFVVQAGVGITESYFIPASETVTTLTTHPIVAKFIAAGSDKGIIALWDVTTSSLLMQSDSLHSSILDIAFSPTDDTFTVISESQVIAIYDQRLKDRVHEKQFNTKLTSIAYSPQGNEIAVGTDQGHILSMDKRYLRSCRNGIKAHESAITRLSFQCDKPKKRSQLSPKASACNVFQHPEKEQRQAHGNAFGGMETNIACHLLQGDAMNKCPPVGEGHKKSGHPRIHHENSPEGLPGETPTQQAVGEMSTYHIIDERSLHEFKESVIQSTKDLVDKVMDQVNADFLRMRMNVSREFCNMELRNRERWQELDETMLMLACLDDSQLSEDIRLAMIHEEAVRDTTGHSKPTKGKKPPEDNPQSDIEYDEDEVDEEVSFNDNQSMESAGIIPEADLNQLDFLDFDNMTLPKRSVASYMPSIPNGIGMSYKSEADRKDRHDDKKNINISRLTTKPFISKIPTQKTFPT